jgi:hypothetical protein
MHFSPGNGWINKLLVPSESAAHEHSNEWSVVMLEGFNKLQQSNFFEQLLCPALVTEVTISP